MEETELKTILSNVAGESPVLKKFSLIDEGSRFVSKVVGVDVAWSDSNLPEKLVVKIPSTKLSNKHDHDRDSDDKENSGSKKLSLVQKVHNTECFCYEVFQQNSSYFEKLQTPAVYSVNVKENENSGFILMEDLNLKYKMASFEFGLELDQIYKLVDGLVDLHIFSFAHPEIVEMLQAFPVYAYKHFPLHVKEIVKELEKHHGDVYRLSRSKIDRIFNFNVVENVAAYSGPLVMAHGSMWAHNLFVPKENENLNPVVIDWTLAHKGSPSEDIARLLTSAMTPERRRHNEPEIIDYYLNHLKMKSKESSVEVPFTDDQFLQDYLGNFPFCAAMLLGHTALLLMHNEKEDKKGKKPPSTFLQNELLIRAIAVCMDALNVA